MIVDLQTAELFPVANGNGTSLYSGGIYADSSLWAPGAIGVRVPNFLQQRRIYAMLAISQTYGPCNLFGAINLTFQGQTVLSLPISAGSPPAANNSAINSQLSMLLGGGTVTADSIGITPAPWPADAGLLQSSTTLQPFRVTVECDAVSMSFNQTLFGTFVRGFLCVVSEGSGI